MTNKSINGTRSTRMSDDGGAESSQHYSAYWFNQYFAPGLSASGAYYTVTTRELI